MKMIFALLCLLAYGQGYATGDSGFYAGLGVGSLALKSEVTIDSKDGTAVDSVRQRIDTAGVAFQGSLGYQRVLSNDYVVGLEGSYLYTNAQASARNCLKEDPYPRKFEAKDAVSIKNTYALTFSMGKRFDRLAPFAKIGVVSSEFEVKASGPNSKKISGVDKKRRFGMALGVGAQYALNYQSGVVVEGTYARYSAFRTKNFDANGGDKHTLKVNPWWLMVLVGLRVRF